MVTADQHFPLSISPSSWKPAEPFLLGTGSNVCNFGCLGLDGGVTRFSSQTILPRESSADDTLSSSGVVAVRLGPPDFAGRGHLASTAGHNGCHGKSGHCQGIAGVDIALQQMNQDQRQHQAGQQLLSSPVHGKFAGLVMVESKYIEVDNTQIPILQQTWTPLVPLHRALLHEHHDFFLASQHPTATPALRRLAPKYAMPARMWRHGIHSFLELLGQSLPALMEHMLAFIYLAYNMMALLYEIVPAFEDTWIKCL
ncbi:hypothetical protein M440DRAFT_1472444 [Trichoderma longibrachiatum ATCC 18648]|uniref:Uncharacterized protein n=1 Tax=Trichoderma longibrachiatum ATCC 18648 TaxID=983965 RepID=A0A2T4BV43_TRILO|nr:hypothetical protein M440DRAFT_1472444 [Trichoderma longibrachiatum ATCC 18648]